MNHLYIGVDPGAKGGIAYIYVRPWKNESNAIKCPGSPTSMADSVRRILHDFTMDGGTLRNTFVGIERVHSMPGQKGMFKFGTNFGMWLGVFGANNIEPMLITPQTWQTMYRKDGLTAGMEGTERRNKKKSIAQDIFKHLKVTQLTSDALLIANYIKEDKK
tara:strand:+ start:1043 stop:1525 length:483 start_codon:yes stop_codon:yes gene_type:complete